MKVNLKNRSFLKLLDFSPEEIEYLIQLSIDLKEAKLKKKEDKLLTNKNIALIFEKTSTRTRCAFEVAAHDQGASVTYIGPGESQMSHKESIRDTARVLGRMFDGIEYRGFGQDIVEELANYSGVPVWNGLTNEFHPTQVLADFMTMREFSNKPLNEIKLCYLGNANSNMGNSLLIGSAKMGIDFRIASPKRYQPTNSIQLQAFEISKKSGAKIQITENIEEAVRGCDYIYTDIWVSMGESESLWADRINELTPYQVNQRTMELTGNSDVKFLHCLPAFHNTSTKIGQHIFEKFGIDEMEVTNEVFEGKSSIVFHQAENRLHTIKAVLVATLS